MLFDALISGYSWSALALDTACMFTPAMLLDPTGRRGRWPLLQIDDRRAESKRFRESVRQLVADHLRGAGRPVGGTVEESPSPHTRAVG